eukprot:279004_1
MSGFYSSTSSASGSGISRRKVEEMFPELTSVSNDKIGARTFQTRRRKALTNPEMESSSSKANTDFVRPAHRKETRRKVEELFPEYFEKKSRTPNRETVSPPLSAGSRTPKSKSELFIPKLLIPKNLPKQRSTSMGSGYVSSTTSPRSAIQTSPGITSPGRLSPGSRSPSRKSLPPKQRKRNKNPKVGEMFPEHYKQESPRCELPPPRAKSRPATVNSKKLSKMFPEFSELKSRGKQTPVTVASRNKPPRLTTSTSCKKIGKMFPEFAKGKHIPGKFRRRSLPVSPIKKKKDDKLIRQMLAEALSSSSSSNSDNPGWVSDGDGHDSASERYRATSDTAIDSRDDSRVSFNKEQSKKLQGFFGCDVPSDTNAVMDGDVKRRERSHVSKQLNHFQSLHHLFEDEINDFVDEMPIAVKDLDTGQTFDYSDPGSYSESDSVLRSRQNNKPQTQRNRLHAELLSKQTNYMGFVPLDELQMGDILFVRGANPVSVSQTITKLFSSTTVKSGDASSVHVMLIVNRTAHGIWAAHVTRSGGIISMLHEVLPSHEKDQVTDILTAAVYRLETKHALGRAICRKTAKLARWLCVNRRVEFSTSRSLGSAFRDPKFGSFFVR